MIRCLSMMIASSLTMRLQIQDSTQAGGLSSGFLCWTFILLFCYNRRMSMQTERSKKARAKQQQGDFQSENGGVVLPAMRPGWVDEAGFPLLPDELPVSTVRDSLYDLIPLGPREEKLIGSVPFLRLQKIKQLGFVYRIWPGATHTR